MAPKKRPVGRPRVTPSERKRREKIVKAIIESESEYEVDLEENEASASKASNASNKSRAGRIRVQDMGSQNFKLNIVATRRYITACHESYLEVMKANQLSNDLKKSLKAVDKQEVVKDESSWYTSWQSTPGIPLHVAHVEDKQLKDLFESKGKKLDIPNDIPKNPPARWTSIKLPFLESSSFGYEIDHKKPEFYAGCGIHSLATKLFEKVEAILEKSNDVPLVGGVLNCGGPIAAMDICPQADENGRELLAVSSFNDVENLVPLEESHSYVQFWSYDPNDLTKSECHYLLEVPHSTVVSLKWCPNISDYPDFKIESKNIGLLAVATTKGTVLIYRIPSSYPKKNVEGTLPISRQKPLFTLIHPNIKVKKQKETQSSSSQEPMEVDGNDSEDFNQVQLFSLNWPVFYGGTKISAISEARRILIWDLTDKPTKLSNPNKHLELSDNVIEPAHVLFESEWDAPPCHTAWISEHEIAIAFRSRTILVYKYADSDVVLKESKTRTAGVLINSQPTLYKGVVSADTLLLHLEGVLYTQTCFLSIENGQYSGPNVPVLNNHQLQNFGIEICPRSGIFSSVGADGRLIQSLQGRIQPHSIRDKEELFTFFSTRSTLHLVRNRRIADLPKKDQPKPAAKKKGEEDENEDRLPILTTKEEVSETMWLELRAGDAALIDSVGMKKQKNLLPPGLLDRRIESLTCVATSPRTAGLTCSGGEAGLVFITPTLL